VERKNELLEAVACHRCGERIEEVEMPYTKERLCKPCFRRGLYWRPGAPPLGNFVQYPGFFRLECGTKAVAPSLSKTWWQAGCDPYRDGEPTYGRSG